MPALWSTLPTTGGVTMAMGHAVQARTCMRDLETELAEAETKAARSAACESKRTIPQAVASCEAWHHDLFDGESQADHDDLYCRAKPTLCNEERPLGGT